MNYRRIALLLLAGGCASSSQGVNPAPAAASSSTTVTTTTTVMTAPVLNPVGTYSFVTEINGQAVPGTITIRHENGQHVGTIHAEGQGDFPISAVKVDGMTLSMTFDTPNGAGTVKVEFVGNDFKGAWELAGQTGPLSGKRTL